MPKHSIRYIPGMGHQVLKGKKVLSTHDERSEAEGWIESQENKEADQLNWKKEND